MQTARGALGSAWGSRGYWCGCVYMCRNCARSGLGPEGGPLAMVPSLAASQIGAPGPAAFPPGPQCPCLYLGPTRHFLGGHREALQDSCMCGLVHGAGLPGVPEGLCLLSSPLSPSACLLPRSPLSSCGNRGGQTRPHTLPPSPRTRARGPQTPPPPVLSYSSCRPGPSRRHLSLSSCHPRVASATPSPSGWSSHLASASPSPVHLL